MSLERLSGIVAHPTSFPSPYGIGDLGKGAYDFIDFLHKSKQKLWQILPLGPTSFGDSPYQSFSTFAGNPMLISPDILVEEGYLTEADLTTDMYFDPLVVDYGPVITYKTGLFQTAFQRMKASGTTLQKSAFQAFCNRHKSWLDDFTLFVALKNHFIADRKFAYETKEYLAYKLANKNKLSEDSINDYFYGAVWGSWPDDIKFREKRAIDKWTGKLADEISYFKFLQYEFFRQWAEVKDYANELGIMIIGDIPIFVAMDSSDVWAHTELFYLDQAGDPTVVAGVPPDYFSETGQLWGNPLYHWQKHKATGYGWWLSRISNTLSLVDTLRIDHFRGFESYWTVPYGEETAIKGKWEKGPGRDLFDEIVKKLGVLPIIAEDLGIITKAVEKLRDDLGLPGMRVLQFSFGGNEKNTYLPHNFNTTNMIVYTGTHDNDTTLGWYEKSGEELKDHFRRYLNVSGEDVAWDLIRVAFSTIADYAIVPIQDVMGLGESARMNTPGVASGNWQFRYRPDMLVDSAAEQLAYLTKLFNRNQEAVEEIDIDDMDEDVCDENQQE